METTLLGVQVHLHPQTGYVELVNIFVRSGGTPETCRRWLQRPSTRMLMDALGALTAVEADAQGRIYAQPVIATAALLHCLTPLQLATMLSRWRLNVPRKSTGTQTHEEPTVEAGTQTHEHEEPTVEAVEAGTQTREHEEPTTRHGVEALNLVIEMLVGLKLDLKTVVCEMRRLR